MNGSVFFGFAVDIDSLIVLCECATLMALSVIARPSIDKH